MRADDRALCYELVLGVRADSSGSTRSLSTTPARCTNSRRARPATPSASAVQLRFSRSSRRARPSTNPSNLAHAARLHSAASFIMPCSVAPAASRLRPGFGGRRRGRARGRRDSHPAWLIARWAGAFGEQQALDCRPRQQRRPRPSLPTQPAARRRERSDRQLRGPASRRAIAGRARRLAHGRVGRASPLLRALADDVLLSCRTSVATRRARSGARGGRARARRVRRAGQ